MSQDPNKSPNEIQTILALCDSARDPFAAVEDVRQLMANGLDWNRFFLLVLWHKVAFLSYERLIAWELLDEALNRAGLPLLLLNHWKQLHAFNALRNARMLEELRAITESMAAHDVPSIVGKGGPLLIGPCYELSERKMYDLDLLAPRDRLREIIAAMSAVGYHLGTYSHARRELAPLPRADLRRWLLLARGLPNFRRVTSVPELEVAIAQVQFAVGSTGRSRHHVPAELLIKHAVPVEVQGSSGRTWTTQGPQLSDVLLQLCLHISRQILDPEHADWGMGWNLIKFCDLQRFACVRDVDPRGFATRAVELNFSEHCRFSLAPADLVLDGSKPGLLARDRSCPVLTFITTALPVEAPACFTYSARICSVIQLRSESMVSW